ncbi:flocculation protein FLO11-like [Trichogramma pretiosum]|uniref:flocculation protein FLO11-like n=1 Tax=Trichogramma pretiosum TaxID=7493 RepID=UPI000C71C5CA|nr:flocculation protein FLO11-like [Trichogramma pretiosum]
MSLAARGLLALLVVACASLTDRPVLAQRQGINNYNGNGNSNNVRWSPQPSAAALRQNPSNLLYQTSNNLVNKPQQQQQQQQQQQRNESPKVVTQDQDSSIEYVEYEYYDDDEEIPGAGAPAAASSTSTSTTSTTTSTTTTTTTTTTTLKPEVRAAKAQSAPVLYDDDDYYYDDEYEDEPQQQVDDDKKSPTVNNNNNKTADGSLLSYKVQKESNETGSVQTSDESSEFIGEVVSVVTTKSVVNGTYSVPEVTESPQPTSTMTSTTKKATTPATTSTTTTTTTTTAAPTSPNTTSKTTTEFSPSSTIQASVQTSRSVSGARFLPYPSIFEFDKPLTKQQQKDKDKQDSNNKNNEAKSEEEEVDEDEKSTADKDEEEDEKKETQVEKQLDEQKDQPEQQPQQPTSDSTESIIDKLDRVQSELSSGFLAHGRFVPRRYQKKPFSTTSLILPPTSTIAPTSSPIPPITITAITKRPRVQTTIEDVSAFLPKDYPKGNNNGGRFTTATKRPKVQTTIEDVSAFLPKDFPRYGQASTTTTSTTTSTKRPKFQTTLEDVEAFLPKDYPKGGYRGSYKRPGSYKTTAAASSNTRTTSSTSTTSTTTSTTEKSTASTSKKVQTTKDDISAFLPPGYKLKPEEATTEKASILTEILLKSKVIGPDNTKISQTSSVSQSSRVSNGSNSQDTSKAKPPLEDLFVKTAAIDAALLPPGYKPEPKSPNRTNDLIVEKIPLAEILAKSAVDVSALLPPGYKPDAVKPLKKSEESNDAAAAGQVDAESDKPSNSNNSKIVYPRRPGGNHRKSPAAKLTTPPVAVQSTPSIKKGWPTRATTEFTGWPTTSTTPISIAKLLEVARTATAGDLSAPGGLVPITSEIDSTTTSTTTTTTTTTTTMRPTTPGLCDGECEVAGTIRIVENANWAPELLDRNTIEWQELAEEIEREMNLVFAKSPVLRKWFRKIRIDSFSPGSVLVDYFVELEDLKERINTQQLKVIFHDSLRTFNFDNPMEVTPVKAPVKLGKFVIDPKSTDFVVIPRIASPKVSEDENRLIPQWAIAVIVVGVTGLLFIIVFGIIVVNRQNGSKLKPALSSIYDDSMTKNVMSSHHNTPAPTPSSRPPAAMLAHHDYQQKHHGGGGHSGHHSSQHDQHHQHHHQQQQQYHHQPQLQHEMWSDPWGHDKTFESSSHKILVDAAYPYERKYNPYDSWKSEWNGYYYPPPATHASGSNFSRHHPDYDNHF